MFLYFTIFIDLEEKKDIIFLNSFNSVYCFFEIVYSQFSQGTCDFFFSPQFKILNVPMSSQLAANHWNQQQAEQEERMRMKKLTLDINERQEQEDYQGTKSFIGQRWKISMPVRFFKYRI